MASRLRYEFTGLGNDHTIATPHEAWDFVQEDGGMGPHAAAAVAFTQNQKLNNKSIDFIGGMMIRFPYILLRGTHDIGEHGQPYYHGLMVDCVWMADEEHLQAVMVCVTDVLAELSDSFEVALEVDEGVMSVGQWLALVRAQLPRVQRCVDMIRLPNFLNMPFLMPETDLAAAAARINSYQAASPLARFPSHEIVRLTDTRTKTSGSMAIGMTRISGQNALPRHPDWEEGSKEEQQILKRFQLEEELLATDDLSMVRKIAYEEWLPLQPGLRLRNEATAMLVLVHHLAKLGMSPQRCMLPLLH